MLFSCGVAVASTVCISERATPLQPTERTLCAELAQSVRNPRALTPDAYQAKLAQFLRNFCHRDEASGWTRDKRVRDIGPYIGTLKDGKWTGTYFGTHAPVITWYSPDMHAWLKANRADEQAGPTEPPPVPDESFHEAITKGKPETEPPPDPPYPSLFTRFFRLLSKTLPTSATVVSMPSETYDHVWSPAGHFILGEPLSAGFLIAVDMVMLGTLLPRLPTGRAALRHMRARIPARRP